MKSFKVVLVLLLSLLAFCQASTFDVSDILKSVSDISKGTPQLMEHVLPTASELFDLGKQAIVGYPFEVVSNIINEFCSTAMNIRAVRPKITPDIKAMHFQFRAGCKHYNYPLMEADQMWPSPEFNATKKVVILATGWTTTINETETIGTFEKAYNFRGDVNFVIVDAASFVNTLCSWSALNTEVIGKAIGTGLVQLSHIVPIENIHLIGHSLGAHIVGVTARKFNELTGKLIDHVTGLDPAKPCFNEGENLFGLQRGDATFIDIVHSNPGVLGKRESMGDVDFYPGGLDPLPPVCLIFICAHARSWEYYAETLYPGNEKNFLASRCSSLTRLRNNKCPAPSIAMGYAAPRNIKGNYFLDVHSEKPYGKASTRTHEEANKDCGLCSNSSLIDSSFRSNPLAWAVDNYKRIF